MSQKHVVTGGAGFIGSHVVDKLVQSGHQVAVLDDLSSGDVAFLTNSMPIIDFVEGDGRDDSTLDELLVGAHTVWHLAADPEVRRAEEEPDAHFELNVGLTDAIIAGMHRNGVQRLGFTSTSTVYGEAEIIPTPEDYAPLRPISAYGSAKLECERRIEKAAKAAGWTTGLFRFANVVGPRSNHGVTFDFVKKLAKNPDRLEILGDGTQTKSYVHVDDTVAGMLHAMEVMPEREVKAFNIGSRDAIPVTEIAAIVAKAMKLEPEYSFTGGEKFGGAGWKGDVKMMALAIDLLLETGWAPAMSSAQAIEDTARWLVKNS